MIQIILPQKCFPKKLAGGLSCDVTAIPDPIYNGMFKVYAATNYIEISKGLSNYVVDELFRLTGIPFAAIQEDNSIFTAILSHEDLNNAKAKVFTKASGKRMLSVI